MKQYTHYYLSLPLDFYGSSDFVLNADTLLLPLPFYFDGDTLTFTDKKERAETWQRTV